MAAEIQPSSLSRRLTAALLDGIAALVVTGLLASTAGMYWAERAVVTFRIEDPESIWKGLGPMLLGLAGPISYGFAAGLLLVLLGEFLFGVSPGKLLTKSSITTENGGPPGPVPLALRFLVKASGALLYCLALVTGRWEILPLAAVASLMVLVGGCGLWGSAGKVYHDRLFGTAVFRT